MKMTWYAVLKKKLFLKTDPLLNIKDYLYGSGILKNTSIYLIVKITLHSKNTALSKKQRESLNLKKVSSFQSQITNDEKKIIKKIIIKFLK